MNQQPAPAAAQPQSIEAQQRARLQRFAMGVGSMLVMLALAAIESATGVLPAPRLAVAALALAGIELVFLAVFLSGLNLKARDPGLTIAQIFWAMVPTLYLMYYAGSGRAAFVMMASVAFLFGIFRLSRRQFGYLTACYLAGYGLVIWLGARYDPHLVNLRIDLIQLCAEAVVLLQIGLIGGYISGLRKRLRLRNDELQGALATIREMATHDELTGISNRRHLMEILEREIRRATRHEKPLSLVMLDLDHFKRINDCHGHNTGDEVLRQIASTIEAACRDVDHFGRYGGEEFLLVLPDTTRREAAVMVERLRRKVADLYIDAAPRHRVTVSAGISQHLPGEDPRATIGRADEALYQAKAAGRNRYATAAPPDEGARGPGRVDDDPSSTNR